MKNLTRHLGLAAMLLVIVHPAWANPGFEMQVDCPDEAVSGSTITTDLHLKNQECTPITVRLMSSIAGNANQSVGGIGIWGPVLADTITVDAAVDNLPGTCGLNTRGWSQCDGARDADCFTDSDCTDGICRLDRGVCDDVNSGCDTDLDCNPGATCVFSCGGTWVGCDTDADCLCQLVTPEIKSISVLAPPAIPISLEGTIATLVLVAEANDGVSDETEVGHCLVNVTAP
jgi:hypothetical protein